MNRTLLVCCCLLLSACGVKRPLMKPEQIPAYEEKQQRRLQELQQQPIDMDDDASLIPPSTTAQ